MTPADRDLVIADIDRARCPEFLAGYVSGLRHDGRLEAVADVVAAKLKREGWTGYEPFPELNPSVCRNRRPLAGAET